jgi:hypothetical protein
MLTSYIHHSLKFSHFYGISLGLSIVNVLVLLNGFRFNYRIDTVEPAPGGDGNSSDEEGAIELGTMETPADAKVAAEGIESQAQSGATTPASVKALPQRKKSILHATFTSKAVWIYAIFILVSCSTPSLLLSGVLTGPPSQFYVGSEVSMGGWIVTFLIEDRDGGAK